MGEKKRTLPLWMLGVTAADKVRDSKEGKTNEIKEPAIINKAKQGKKSLGNTPPGKEGDNKVPANFRRDQKEKIGSTGLENFARKKRKESLAAGAHDMELIDETSGMSLNKGKKVSIRDENDPDEPMRKKKLKHFEHESAVDSGNLLQISEDEIDLTDEDLMRIAQEYVNADAVNTKDKRDPLPLPRESLSISSGHARRESPPCGHAKGETSTVEKICFSSDFPANESNEEVKVLVSMPTTKSTEETVDEMLDLFLGPLLHKTLKGQQQGF